MNRTNDIIQFFLNIRRKKNSIWDELVFIDREKRNASARWNSNPNVPPKFGILSWSHHPYNLSLSPAPSVLFWWLILYTSFLIQFYQHIFSRFFFLLPFTHSFLTQWHSCYQSRLTKEHTAHAYRPNIDSNTISFFFGFYIPIKMQTKLSDLLRVLLSADIDFRLLNGC